MVKHIKDWWWYDDESPYSPVISGGLVATTRSWWQESGGFDPGMHGWGFLAFLASGWKTDRQLCPPNILRQSPNLPRWREHRTANQNLVVWRPASGHVFTNLLYTIKIDTVCITVNICCIKCCETLLQLQF